MNLASFAELAVRLVNSAVHDGSGDPLRTADAYRQLVADRPFLSVPVTQHDLDHLKLLRTEFNAIFAAAAAGDDATVAARLNGLLVTHPLQPVLVNHDGERWHLHLSDSGSAADRYAACAVSGLMMIVTQVGLHKLGVCSIAACDRVFIDGSSNRSRRYCSDHSPNRSNVAALTRPHRYGSDSAASANSATG